MCRQMRIGVFSLASVLLLALSGQAQQFLLRIPGQPNQDSQAELTRSGLRVTDARGRVFDYSRAPDGDSRDGRYRAYHSPAARRYLRWPVAGRGSMYLGESAGASIAWRESQMQVAPTGPVDPKTNAPVVGDSLIQRPMSFAVLDRPAGNMTLAHVDADGQLQFYSRHGDGWQRVDTGIPDRFPPGIPLTLYDEPRSEYPVVVFADAQGRLSRVVNGRRVERISDSRLPLLSPYAHLQPFRGADTQRLYTVDGQGRLWLLDLERGQHQLVEPRERSLPPGAPLSVVAGDRPRVALIDRRGDLVSYVSDGRGDWSRPDPIASGLTPGGYVSSAVLSHRTAESPNVYFASVDAAGRTRLFTQQRGRWLTEAATPVRLPPGSPVDLAMTDRGLGLTAVGMDGRWRYWQRHAGRWSPQLIADGFLANAPVAFFPAANCGFAVDRRGRPIAARHHGGRWRCAVCSPHHLFAPQLVSRRIVPDPPLPAAAIQLGNQHSEPLVVKMADRRTPGRPVELRIEAGQSMAFQADRDAGATLEEVYLVPGPLGTLVEQVHQYPLPPQPLYDAVVYADRVTSTYFDRTKNRSDVPDSINKSLVSVGVFSLPPGEFLQPNARIDVYREARYHNNPGAAAWLGQP